ncbi:MAG: hypothetical protein AABZ68_01195, partial [Candidatus Deferrimicrobiota bacterium]
METTRKSPRSARAIFGRFERMNIVRIISGRPGSCKRKGSDIERRDVQRVLLDEFAARLDLVA